MKIVHLSTCDMTGGAARAAYRLHHALLDRGAASRMLVRTKASDERAIIGPTAKLDKASTLLRTLTADAAVSLLRPRVSHNFSLQGLPDNIPRRVRGLSADVVNLHWVSGGFLGVGSIGRFSIPIVWTLHDMWPFTGGCHYSDVCLKYREACGKCPQLGSKRVHDPAHWFWKRKQTAWQQADMTIVAPSRWIFECAKSSSLFRDLRIEHIANGIDVDRFRPIDRHIARDMLSLPRDKFLILVGAARSISDERKGFHLLDDAMRHIAGHPRSKAIELLILGASEPENPTDYGIKTRYLGEFHDDIALSMVYSAADVFLTPSMQDNLPNMVMEALVCGVPCVAFQVGGLLDLIDHEQTGFLVTPFDTSGLANGVLMLLDDDNRRAVHSRQARNRAASKFSVQRMAESYLRLYEDIVTRRIIEKN